MNKYTCKFYNGDYHNTHCEAGVCYKDVTTGTDKEPGSAYRKPCIDWPKLQSNRKDARTLTESQQKEWDRRGTCDKWQAPTDEEIKAVLEMEAEFDAKLNLVTKFVNEIRKPYGEGKPHTGVYECPACKGKLHVNIAGYNGHARVMCETKECVRWME